jgi:biopolymer transport protein ExbB
MENELSFASFLAQIDGVGISVLVLLLSLSVSSWYLIITKSIGGFIEKRRAKAFLKHFWSVDSLQAVDVAFESKTSKPNNAFAQLAKLGIDAASDSKNYSSQRMAAAGGTSEFLTRALRNGIDKETTRTENGLTLLASAGSAAPYIGLLGTVWGIYHALIQIGLSGQGTLDKIAGPVGEALIMTALGLAVAIPAVLAYNTFVRHNRILMSHLDAFAHDLFMLLTVDDKSDNSSNSSQSPASSTSTPPSTIKGAR